MSRKFSPRGATSKHQKTDSRFHDGADGKVMMYVDCHRQTTQHITMSTKCQDISNVCHTPSIRLRHVEMWRQHNAVSTAQLHNSPWARHPIFSYWYHLEWQMQPMFFWKFNTHRSWNDFIAMLYSQLSGSNHPLNVTTSVSSGWPKNVVGEM